MAYRILNTTKQTLSFTGLNGQGVAVAADSFVDVERPPKFLHVGFKVFPVATLEVSSGRPKRLVRGS
jgi:hypothetical protein